MAKNDTVLLDGIVDQRVTEAFPTAERDEVFEYLCFEQVLKNYDLSREEIESGWVDGRDDGGIDGFFTFVNGHLLRDPKDFAWPKANAEIVVWILTCKHHDTFKQAPLNSLYASVSELFDFSIDREHFRGAYSASLAHARSLFQTAYRKLAAASPTLIVRYAYVSRGDAKAVEPNVAARATQTVEITRPLFSSSECQFDFIGAAELVAMYRRVRRFSIELPVQEFLSRGQSGYIVLSGLRDYSNFVTDDDGALRRYLFDSNVRDYLGKTQVNADILKSLGDSEAPDFWWLNNGVTILATDATVVGKTINLVDIQIVNGLQTTESIYRHFRQTGRSTGDRTLLIKIIVSKDTKHRDRIILATNNQNIVEIAGLRASDKIQRDIEEFLEQHGWYYERRKNYYKNIGKPQDRFVTPMYLAGGYVSLVMKNPGAAAKLRSKFMRKDASYGRVFSEKHSVQVWHAIARILKRIESLLNKHRPGHGSGEKFLAGWRNLVGFFVVSKIHGKFSYSVPQLASLEDEKITPELVAEVWTLVAAEIGETYKVSLARKTAFVTGCCARAATEWSLDGLETVGRQGMWEGQNATKSKKVLAKEQRREQRREEDLLKSEIADEVISRVAEALPEQPWPPGVHREVASKLSLDPRHVSAAIGRLIKAGRKNQQKDGVVYGPDGSILAIDENRTDRGAEADSTSSPTQ